MRDSAIARLLFEYLAHKPYEGRDETYMFQANEKGFMARVLLLLSYLQVDETDIDQFCHLERESRY